MKQRIGERIRNARIRKGLSQETLAELTNSSLSRISRLETGKTMVSIENLIQIANVLDVGIDELLQDFIRNGSVEEQLRNRIGLLLRSCTREQQLYWVENLQLYVDCVKTKKKTGPLSEAAATEQRLPHGKKPPYRKNEENK